MPRALQPGMEQRSVLVVDDDLAMREMLVSLFREHGYRAEPVARADEALARLRDAEFDAVLSDIRMPGKSGIEMVGEVKQLRPATPVILMTAFGYDPSHAIVRARQEGLKFVLYKPFRVDQLVAALESPADERPDSGT